MGLDVDITELDIRIRDEIADDKLFQQANLYKRLMEIVLAFEKSAVYTLWGFTDAHSWIPHFFTDTGSALIFDEAYSPKPAFYELQTALQTGPIDLSHYEEVLNTSVGDRHLMPAFRAMPVSTPPVIDGTISPGEWDQGVLYRFAYNQLNPQDQRPPLDLQDLYGEWKILYNGNTIYGLIVREDDVTVTDRSDTWENDNVEVFFDMKGQFAQLRSIVGSGDWEDHAYEGVRQAVWSADGNVLEFSLELPESDVKGLTIGWNIALSDNDTGADGTRDHQLYPIYGFNDSWQGKNLAEIFFQE